MSKTSGALAPMTPNAFINKWKRARLTERQASHEHFIDLCHLLNHPTPAESDQLGLSFAFEKGATKIGGGKGFADVWKKDHFAWEYKRQHADLDRALLQLIRYAPALESPPLQVVCDVDQFRIHTAWTNTISETHEIKLTELSNPSRLEILRNVFHDPEQLRPKKTRASLTREAADKFSTIAFRLQGRGNVEDIAHFVNQLVFCFFADSVKLLQPGLFTKLLRRAAENPKKATHYLDQLFAAMEKGGDFDLTDIAWFNGGLFDGRRSMPLDEGDIDLLLAAAALDWSQIDPSVFGTLFERFLDPTQRAQIGAHYTDPEKILKIIEPVILAPLRREWAQTHSDIQAVLSGRRPAPFRQKGGRRMKRREGAEELRSRYTERLRTLKILDPACGSGNFLYMTLQAVKDIENQANLECEMLGLEPRAPTVGPEILRGIETNPLAAELARTTIWIGDIQWQIRNGIHARPRPILRKLDAIECRDALVRWKADGSYEEAQWPAAEFIVGNPPFLGAKLMKRLLGPEETARLRATFADRLPGFTDLVCYWFEKARAQIEKGITKRAGLVATNSIAKNTNLPVLNRICNSATIYEAWADEPWIVNGAAVRVALICFADRLQSLSGRRLNGIAVESINSDLTSGLNVSAAPPLGENRNIGYVGIQKSGPFDIPGDLARQWALMPTNPNGRRNSDILKPTWNGRDVTTSRRDIWFIDFPRGLTEREAALWEAPFTYLQSAPYDPDNPASPLLSAVRQKARDIHPRREWWTTYWPRPEVRAALAPLSRYIATPMTAEHRIFLWLRLPTLPDNNLVIIARDDDVHFGILHSFIHEAWSTRIGNKMGAGNQRRYNREAIYDTFPFPEGLTPNISAKDYAKDPRAIIIAQAAKCLDDLRNAWLNPPDLIDIVPEVVPGYPDRILPKNEKAAAELKKRTLTNLYNARPQWLADAHRDLDAAVAAAYGWPADISEDEVLAKLLELNLSRAGAGKAEAPDEEDEAEE